LFEHETGGAEAVRFVPEFLRAVVSVPFIVLRRKPDEQTVAESIQKGTRNCVSRRNWTWRLWSALRNALVVPSLQLSSKSRSSLCKYNLGRSSIYHEIWRAILSGSVHRGIPVNRKRNRELYSQEESICPVRDAAGQITHFISNDCD
jgi:hypothetical protein